MTDMILNPSTSSNGNLSPGQVTLEYEEPNINFESTHLETEVCCEYRESGSDDPWVSTCITQFAEIDPGAESHTLVVESDNIAGNLEIQNAFETFGRVRVAFEDGTISPWSSIQGGKAPDVRIEVSTLPFGTETRVLVALFNDEPNAEIYYIIEVPNNFIFDSSRGLELSQDSGLLYDGPISFPRGTIVNVFARAYAPGRLPSDIATLTT